MRGKYLAVSAKTVFGPERSFGRQSATATSGLDDPGERPQSDLGVFLWMLGVRTPIRLRNLSITLLAQDQIEALSQRVAAARVTTRRPYRDSPFLQDAYRDLNRHSDMAARLGGAESGSLLRADVYVPSASTAACSRSVSTRASSIVGSVRSTGIGSPISTASCGNPT